MHPMLSSTVLFANRDCTVVFSMWLAYASYYSMCYRTFDKIMIIVHVAFNIHEYMHYTAFPAVHNTIRKATNRGSVFRYVIQTPTWW